MLGQDYRPIPGPFAAGNTAGSRFGIQYTTIYCGASVSFAVTQGKFASTWRRCRQGTRPGGRARGPVAKQPHSATSRQGGQDQNFAT